MKTITQKIEELRDRYANTFKQEALRKNGTATKEYLDHLEAFVVTHDSSCKGCRDYNNGAYHPTCKSCRRYCADLWREK
ncbi:MAG TPA: hypothetical protein PLZ43_08040 [bacterium]|nr:hypothetical protein [bacterium]